MWWKGYLPRIWTDHNNGEAHTSVRLPLESMMLSKTAFSDIAGERAYELHIIDT